MHTLATLKQTRLQKGLSLKAVADKIGTTKSQIDKLEKGERRLTVDWLMKLSEALDIEPASLFEPEHLFNKSHAQTHTQTQTQTQTRTQARTQKSAANDALPHQSPIHFAAQQQLKAPDVSYQQTFNWPYSPVAQPAASVSPLPNAAYPTQSLPLTETRRRERGSRPLGDPAQESPGHANPTQARPVQADHDLTTHAQTPHTQTAHTQPSPVPMTQGHATHTHIPHAQGPTTTNPYYLPVYGYCDLFSDRLLHLAKQSSTVLRPPNLIGVADAFAVHAVGNSMEPRFFDGDLLFIHPGKRLVPGAFVLVILHDDQGIVARFEKKTATGICVSFLNEKDPQELTFKQFDELYRIIGSFEAA